MKKIALLLVVLLLAGTFAFAGGGAQGAGGIIGIAMPESHVLRWIKDGASLVAEVEKRGYTALHQNAGADQLVQNQQIQSFFTQGARALIVGSINDGIGSVIREAHRDGIPVVAYDRIIQGSTNFSAFITFNNYKVGTLQGESLVQGMNLAAATTANPRYITLFAGSPTDANANFFFQGAMDVLLPYIDRGVLRVVGPFPRHYTDTANFLRIATEGWSGPIAKARMEALLIGDAAGVTLDAVLSPNDTLALSIIEALRADARYRDRLPAVSGQDAEFSSMMSIRNGEQYSTVFKDTAKLAEAAAILIDQILRGQTIRVPGVVEATGDLREIGWTGTGYVPTYLLDPILVTRNSNFNAPIDAEFYTAAEASQLR